MIDNKAAIDCLTTKYMGRCGVAFSQLFLGNWTAELYEQKCKQYRDEMKREFFELYDKENCQVNKNRGERHVVS